MHLTFTLDKELVQALYKLCRKTISPDPVERQSTPKLNRRELTIVREILPILELRLTELHPEEPDPICYPAPGSITPSSEKVNLEHTRRREAQDNYLRDFNSILATFGGDKPGE